MNINKIIDLVSVIENNIKSFYHYEFDNDYNLSIKNSYNENEIKVFKVAHKDLYKKLDVYNTIVYIPMLATYKDVVTLMENLKVANIENWKLPDIDELRELYKLANEPDFWELENIIKYESPLYFWTCSPHSYEWCKTIVNYSLETGAMNYDYNGDIILISKEKAKRKANDR